jgi:Zn-dependent peptidase ImmA (M78 family)
MPCISADKIKSDKINRSIIWSLISKCSSLQPESNSFTMNYQEITINPSMLVLARETRGMSQKELGEKLDISPSFICKVETDVKALPSPLLDLMGRVLKYPPQFFYQPGEAYIPMSLNYRKRDHVAAKAMNVLEAQINLYRLNLERVLEKIKPKPLNIPHADLSKGNIEQAAKLLRKAWEIPKGPIVNLTAFAEDNGIIVINFEFPTHRIDSRTTFTTSGIPIIAINKLHFADRQRFSLAYELGHLVLHRKVLPSADRDISHEANCFAAALLMPEKEIKPDLAKEKNLSIERLAELKRKWKVSMQALLYRASDVKLLNDNQKYYLLRQFNSLKIRKREPVELDFPMEKPMQFRKMITKYKDVHKFSTKELASSLCLEVEDFISRYD